MLLHQPELARTRGEGHHPVGTRRDRGAAVVTLEKETVGATRVVADVGVALGLPRAEFSGIAQGLRREDYRRSTPYVRAK